MTEWTHPVVLANIPAGGQRLRLAAPEAALPAIAARLGLPAVAALSAEVALSPGRGGRVEARGTLRARVTQECVVTLAPLPAEVAEEIAWRLLPPGEEPSDGDDDPDDIPSDEAGVVDLGEELVQQLSLALDPYPRAPGAEIPPEHAGGAHGPFAALARLKRE
ncbi:YceD family protein [Roseococcus sp. DSY-14]|uniref:YceD family protein n=1 Tax=Roseococcus sp. DSY-14 TaxID=3369650 RepID=UPI00387B2BF8